MRKGCAGRLGHRNFTSVFGDRTSFRAKGLRRTTCKSQFYRSFWWSNLVSCERVAIGPLKSQFYLTYFWRSNLISCEKVARDDLDIAILPQFLAIEPRFVRKGCVSCGLVGTAPAPAFKREIEKKERARGQEGKRARGQEGKRARARGQEEKMWGWEDVKMRRCEDEKMWRWEDEKMRRCEDEKMWKWADEKIWGWEDVKKWRWEDVKMRGCEDEKMWRWEDVKMWGCEDGKMWGWEDEDERMWRCEDVKMRRCEDVRMWRWEDVRMRRCEEEKIFYRPPLLEEPCAQTLSGNMLLSILNLPVVSHNSPMRTHAPKCPGTKLLPFIKLDDPLAPLTPLLGALAAEASGFSGILTPAMPMIEAIGQVPRWRELRLGSWMT